MAKRHVEPTWACRGRRSHLVQRLQIPRNGNYQRLLEASTVLSLALFSHRAPTSAFALASCSRLIEGDREEDDAQVDPIEARQSATDEELTRHRRREVQGILDSYHNTDIDCLAEMVQNAVDEVLRTQRRLGEDYDPQVSILIDPDKRIRVTDNAGGFREGQLPSALAPNVSFKDDDDEAAGEKGAGLAFLAYGHDRILVETLVTDESGHQRGLRYQMTGGLQWVEKGDPLSISSTDVDPPNATTFEIDVSPLLPEVDSEIRDSWEFWATLLRTRTYAGFVEQTLEGPPPIQVSKVGVTLTVVTSEGDEIEKPLPFGFLYPHQAIKKSEALYLQPDKTIPDNPRASLAHKRWSGEALKSLLNYNDKKWRTATDLGLSYVYGSYVPNNRMMANFVAAQALGLGGTEWNSTQGEERAESAVVETGLKSTVIVALKGMPMSVGIPVTVPGNPEAASRTFVLVCLNARLDLGRKTLPNEVERLVRDVYRAVAKWFHNSAGGKEKLVKRHVVGLGADSEEAEGDTAQEKAENAIAAARSKSRLPLCDGYDFPLISFQPANEAEVALLFWQLLVVTHNKLAIAKVGDNWSEYDLYLADATIEFKRSLSNLFNDVSPPLDSGDATKWLAHIDLLVVWDTPTNNKWNHKAVPENEGYSLKKKEVSVSGIVAEYELRHTASGNRCAVLVLKELDWCELIQAFQNEAQPR